MIPYSTSRLRYCDAGGCDNIREPENTGTKAMPGLVDMAWQRRKLIWGKCLFKGNNSKDISLLVKSFEKALCSRDK